VEQIAAGGFGNIYRAKHREWGTVVYKELKSTFIAERSKLVTMMILHTVLIVAILFIDYVCRYFVDDHIFNFFSYNREWMPICL